jgi:hypothetical protein
VPRCFYCNQRATVFEHVVPPWIPHALGLAQAERAHVPERRSRAEREALARRTLPTSIPAHPEWRGETFQKAYAELVVERDGTSPWEEYGAEMLCPICAAVLHHVDEDGRPLVEALMHGGALELEPDAQRIVAAWAVRRAYALLVTSRKAHAVPRSHRTALRRQGIPHQAVLVAIGRSKPEGVLTLASRVELTIERGGAEHRQFVYPVLMVLGTLVVRVFGAVDPPPGATFRLPQGRLVRLWPRRAGETQSWPPVWSLDEVGIEELFRYNHLRLYKPSMPRTISRPGTVRRLK